MERYKESMNRNQMNLLPMSFDDMIDAENPVRAIDAIVENMDIPTLGFKYAKTAATGRKPYSPVDMFKLYTYSYFNGIRSSRKIERECGRNIEVMWLIGGLAPDFKTIADFRKDNKVAIKNAFSRFSLLCDGLGLIGKEIVAVDVTSEAVDREQLHNVSVQAKEELDVPALTVIADKGYYSAKQFMLCEEAGISVIAPKPTLQSAPDERYAKDKFVYDEN
ncbi:MAG: transposase, partial [Clostridia bacterium]